MADVTYTFSINSTTVNPIYKDCTITKERFNPAAERTLFEGDLIFLGADFDLIYALYSAGDVNCELIITGYDNFTNKVDFIGEWNVTKKYAKLRTFTIDKYYNFFSGNEYNQDTKIPLNEKIGLHPIETTVFEGANYFKACAWFNKLIEVFAQLIDSNVTVDSTTFDFFDSLQDIRYLYFTDAKNYNTTPSYEVELSFKELTDFFADNLNIYWSLTDGKVLRLTYYEWISYNPAVLDLSQYQEFNSFKENDRYSTIRRQTEFYNNNEDFRGVDISYDRMNVYNRKEINVLPVTDYDLVINSEFTSGLFLISTDLDYTTKLFTTIYGGPYFPLAAFDTITNGAGTFTLGITTSTGADVYAYMTPLTFDPTYNSGDILYYNFDISSISLTINVKLGGWYNGDLYYFEEQSFTTVGSYQMSGYIDRQFTSISVIFVANESGASSVIIDNSELLIATHFMIYDGIGAISGQTIKNVGVSIANLDQNYKTEHEDTQGIINGASETGLVKRNTKELSIIAPIFQPISSYDFAEKVTTLSGDCSLEKIQRYCDGKPDEITLKIIE